MRDEKKYKELVSHNTAELPIALHYLQYPADREILFYLHWHREFEFFAVLEGHVELTVEDRVYNLEEGGCVFINSNQYHSARNLHQTHCRFFALDFTREFLEEQMHTHFSREYICPVLDYRIKFPEIIHNGYSPASSWQKEIINDLMDIFYLGENNLFVHELTVKARIYNIWEQLFLHAERTQDIEGQHLSELRNKILPILDYIQLNFSCEITLTELAGLLSISEGQLCRIFKMVMKVTPFQYLMRYRIMQSCSLLVETDKKIGEIANLTGFNNISYYNRIFLHIIGCTPREYRQSYCSSPVLIDNKSFDT